MSQPCPAPRMAHPPCDAGQTPSLLHLLSKRAESRRSSLGVRSMGPLQKLMETMKALPITLLENSYLYNISPATLWGWWTPEDPMDFPLKPHGGHFRSPCKMVPKALPLSETLCFCTPRQRPGGESSPSLSPGGWSQERRGAGASLPSSLTWGVSGAGMAITHRANLSLQCRPDPTPSSEEQN